MHGGRGDSRAQGQRLTSSLPEMSHPGVGGLLRLLSLFIRTFPLTGRRALLKPI